MVEMSVASRSRRRGAARLAAGCMAAAVLLFPAIGAAGSEGDGAARTLSLGAMPSHSLVQLEAFWAPLASYLSERLGRSVRFGTSSSFARFQDRLRRRDFDVAFVQASDFAAIGRSLGYVPLVRLVRPPALVFFVRPDSGVRQLTDLRGQTIALPPEESDANAAARRRLQDAGLPAGSAVSVAVQAQDNACIQQVVSGRSAAGVVTENALSLVGLREEADYRVIDAGLRVEPPLFVAAPTLTPQERAILTAALLAWPKQASQRGGPANLGWLELAPVAVQEPAASREGR